MFYLFHHIPKTGGISCQAAFGQLFDIVSDYHPSTSKEVLKRYEARRIKLGRLGENDILCGHWNIPGHYLYQRYPDLDDFGPRKITFIRDPLSTAQSGVRFGVKQGWCRSDNVNGALVARAGYFHKMLNCDETNFKSILDTYWFVGVTEKLQGGFDLLTSLLTKECIQIVRENTTDEIKISFSDDAVAKFVEHSRVDYMIYEYAKTLYEQRLQSAGSTTLEPIGSLKS